jgi:hypothetical protein
MCSASKFTQIFIMFNVASSMKSVLRYSIVLHKGSACQCMCFHLIAPPCLHPYAYTPFPLFSCTLSCESNLGSTVPASGLVEIGQVVEGAGTEVSVQLVGPPARRGRDAY